MSIPISIHCLYKDILGAIGVALSFFHYLFYYPYYFSHSDNYIIANAMLTPEHIVPEWYFLCFYAILRAIPDKRIGVIAMFSVFLIIALLPYFSNGC